MAQVRNPWHLRALLSACEKHGVTIGPNLTVTAASVAPPAGNLGDQFSVSYTIANQGTADAVGLDMGPGGEFGWNDHIYFSIDQTWDGSDTLVSENFVPGVLFPGESYSQTLRFPMPTTVPGGAHYLLIVTDAFDAVGETAEANNVKAIPISLTAPDLVTTTATGPSSAILNGAIDVSWSVSNQGSVPAAGDWSDGIYLSRDNKFDLGDSFVYSEDVPGQTPLMPGTTYTAYRSITIPNVGIGTFWLLFITNDPNSQPQQGEMNRSNNVFAIPITLNAPDLIVTSVSAPTLGLINGSIDVSWTVKNQGIFAAPADWTDLVYLSREGTQEYYFLGGEDIVEEFVKEVELLRKEGAAAESLADKNKLIQIS